MLQDQTGWLLHSIVLDGKGSGKLLSEKDFKHWKPEDGCLWAHMNLADPRTLKWIEEKSNLDELILESLLEEDPRPRCVGYGDDLLLILRAINLNPGEEPDDMISLSIWCEKGRILTFRSSPLNATFDVSRKIMSSTRGPTSEGEMLDELISAVLDRVSEAVADIEYTIDTIEEKIIADAEDEDESDFVAPLSEARRKLSEMRRYLSPQRDALDVLSRQNTSWLSKDDHYQLRENGNRMFRIVEDIDGLRERAIINRDEIASRVSEYAQDNMYTISIVAALFIPLTFLTGLFGMNVGGIPFSEHDHGLLIVSIIMAILVLFMLFIFKRLRWF